MSEIQQNDKVFYANGVLLVVYITLKPIYLWSSGSVQLCDMVLLLGIALNLIKIRGKLKFRKTESRYIKVMTALCVYQTIVNFVWSVYLGENILKPSLFYFFNLFAVCLFILIIDKIGLRRMKRCITTGSFLSLLLTAVSIVITAGTKRSTGLFNNPNQLGYYALLLFSLAIVCWSASKPAMRISIIVLSIFAIIASSSKAAFAGMVVTVFFYVLSQGTKLTIKKIFILALIILVARVFLYWFFFSDNSILLSNSSVMRMRYRILNMFNENDSDLGTGRGYDRIYELGINFLWGKGEGAYYRFNSLKNVEAHSTYVSLLVSYGLIGFIGYMYLFFKAVYDKKKFLMNLGIISGAFVYQITHNGIRNTLFWLLIVLLLVDKTRSNTQMQVNTIEPEPGYIDDQSVDTESETVNEDNKNETDNSTDAEPHVDDSTHGDSTDSFFNIL